MHVLPKEERIRKTKNRKIKIKIKKEQDQEQDQERTKKRISRKVIYIFTKNSKIKSLKSAREKANAL